MSMEISIIEECSDLYPESLRQIASRPKRLYCAGDVNLLKEESIAVVGSRRFTMYGKQVAQMVGRTLGSVGIPVVSGMASGIDTFAHEGVLDEGGRPIVVLGTGLYHPYPKKNIELFERVIDKGLVVSEYEPDFPGHARSFPARNRIIAGLSKAIVIIEANVKSGSLITAQFGIDQGKPIYAVPGNINSQFSMGTNLLIRDGAMPLVVVDDLLREMNKAIPQAERVEESLGDEERKVFATIKNSNGISVDDISHILNKKASEVNAILTILEIKGVVTSYGGRLHLTK